MSERAADDVRGEPRRAAGGAAAARQQQQPQPLQPQRQHPPPRRPRPEDGGPGAASTSAAAMATLGERRPLPSPEAMLGQPWNLWVEASKLPGKDGECPRLPAPHAPHLPPSGPAPLPRTVSCDPPPRGVRDAIFRWVWNAEVPTPTLCVRERASHSWPLTCLSPPPVCVYLLGTELDESFKEFGKHREVMGLCREGESSPLPPSPPPFRVKFVPNPGKLSLLLQPTFPACHTKDAAEEERGCAEHLGKPSF